jgi:hypothetical protein
MIRFFAQLNVGSDRSSLVQFLFAQNNLNLGLITGERDFSSH